MNCFIQNSTTNKDYNTYYQASEFTNDEQESFSPNSNLTLNGDPKSGSQSNSCDDASLSIRLAKFSDFSTVSNCVSALLGVSIFAVPWGFQQSGVLGGVILSTFLALLSFETARILLLAQKRCYLKTGEAKGYAAIAEMTLGSGWSVSVEAATIISCLGGCIGNLIFFGETLGQVFSLESSSVILYATIPLILVSWIRSFHELSILTAFGIATLSVAVMAIIYDGSMQYRMDLTTNTNPTTIALQSAAMAMKPTGLKPIPLFLPWTIVNFVGPATFLFTIHYCILSMGAEYLQQHSLKTKEILDKEHCENSNKPRDSNTLDDEESISSIRPVSIGKRRQVVSNEESGTMKEMDGNGLELHPMYFHSNNYQDLSDKKSSDKGIVDVIGRDDLVSPLSSGTRIDRCCSLYSPFIVDHTAAELEDKFASSLAVSYLLTVIVISLVGSAGFYLFRFADPVKDSNGELLNGCEDSVCQNIVLNLSPGTLRDAVGVSISLSIIVNYVLILAPAREYIEGMAISSCRPTSAVSDSVMRATVRTIVVLLTVVVAICAPYFGTVMGTIGGFTDAFQCFVLPPLIYRSLFDHSLAGHCKVFYAFIFLFGVGVILHTSFHAMNLIVGGQ
mmetsp:Transcript_4289/g.5903  ORF Transcript_4289/g.5903 Transcript_4289/m.5903 type:complete len:618 (-) Transcript_4289:136-1989(-)